MRCFHFSLAIVMLGLNLKNVLTGPIRLIRGLRQGSILSLSYLTFSLNSLNILTTTITRTINGGIYSDLCDFSLICYAGDVLLISSSLSTLQANVDSLISSHKLLGLNVTAAKTEFLAYSARGKALSSSFVIVAGKSIIESSSLKYLGFAYGPDKLSTRVLTTELYISGFRASYAELAALKHSYSKCVLAKLYSALALPHVLYISPLWDSLSKTEQLKVR